LDPGISSSAMAPILRRAPLGGESERTFFCPSSSSAAASTPQPHRKDTVHLLHAVYGGSSSSSNLSFLCTVESAPSLMKKDSAYARSWIAPTEVSRRAPKIAWNRLPYVFPACAPGIEASFELNEIGRNRSILHKTSVEKMSGSEARIDD
jgi:hypothetical protein